MVGILKLFMDPNELELATNSPMSDIEKECRRRLWWLVRGMVAMSPNTMKMIEGHITVSRALPISVYHAMPVDLDSPPQFVELDMYDIEDLSHDLNSIAKSIQDFVDTVVAENRSVNNCFIEADLLMEQLRLWYSRCPQWFHTVLDSTNICTSTDRKPHEIPFLAFHIHLMYFSLPLTLYRFVFSSFCLFPPELQTPRSRSPAVQQALDICWNSINLIMLAYRTKPILMEASSYTTYPYVLGPLLHSIAFSCTMSKFADTPEQCIAATRDFKFTRQLLAKIISGSSNWQFVNYFLEDIDRVNSLPAGLERMNETMRLFTFHSQLFEKLFLKKGILTSVL
ncbi:hypothetical protein HK098_006743 [Nowakowskiella sp. JEL0407]|nr:hypothetical protein HK098_006743 [Nowakowskiella sp. JEL0407]